MSSDFPEMDEALSNHALFEPPAPLPIHALPDRQYLEQAILPLLSHGLEATAKQRPNDPLEFLAAYLISNNPQRADPLPQPPHPMLYGAGFATVSATQNLQAARTDLVPPPESTGSPQIQSAQSAQPTSKK